MQFIRLPELAGIERFLPYRGWVVGCPPKGRKRGLQFASDRPPCQSRLANQLRLVPHTTRRALLAAPRPARRSAAPGTSASPDTMSYPGSSRSSWRPPSGSRPPPCGGRKNARKPGSQGVKPISTPNGRPIRKNSKRVADLDLTLNKTSELDHGQRRC